MNSAGIVLIPGYLDYGATPDGQIWSKARTREWRPMGGTVDHWGYWTVNLNKGDLRRIHCLIASVFIGVRPHGLVINHKDGNKLNNNVENLEYISQKGNVRHALDTGLFCREGESNPHHRLTVSQVSRIICQRHAGVEPAVVAAEYGVSCRTIRAIVQGKRWKHIDRTALTGAR